MYADRHSLYQHFATAASRPGHGSHEQFAGAPSLVIYRSVDEVRVAVVPSQGITIRLSRTLAVMAALVALVLYIAHLAAFTATQPAIVHTLGG